MWPRLLVGVLLLVAGAFVFAQVYIPPLVLQRVPVVLYETGQWFSRNWSYVIALLAGAAIAELRRELYVEDAGQYEALRDEVERASGGYVEAHASEGGAGGGLTIDLEPVRDWFMGQYGETMALTSWGQPSLVVVRSATSAAVASALARDAFVAANESKVIDFLSLTLEFAHGVLGRPSSTGSVSESPYRVYYVEAPEIWVNYVPRLGIRGGVPSYGARAVTIGPGLYGVEVEPSVSVFRSGSQYTAVAVPQEYVAVVLFGYDAYASLEVDWCGGYYSGSAYGLYYMRYALESVVPESGFYRAVYRASEVGRAGGFLLSMGSLPYDERTWGFSIYRLAASYDDAVAQVLFDSFLVMRHWAGICTGTAGEVVRPYPWDVEGAPDFGVAVRQRDGAAVWWVVRPLEALRDAFIPRRSLADRLTALLHLASARFPFSVATALRSVSPTSSLQDVAVSVPCFAVGGGRYLCPEGSVWGFVSTASRTGVVVVLVVGVYSWLGRRLLPWLRV